MNINLKAIMEILCQRYFHGFFKCKNEIHLFKIICRAIIDKLAIFFSRNYRKTYNELIVHFLYYAHRLCTDESPNLIRNYSESFQGENLLKQIILPSIVLSIKYHLDDGIWLIGIYNIIPWKLRLQYNVTVGNMLYNERIALQRLSYRLGFPPENIGPLLLNYTPTRLYYNKAPRPCPSNDITLEDSLTIDKENLNGKINEVSLS